MTRPSDEHFDRVDDEAYQRAGQIVEAIEDEGLPYILSGGWAVFAHEPKIPSVDVDLFLPAEHSEPVVGLLQDQGWNVESGGEVELLGLEREIEIWGIGDPDLGIEPPSFVPGDILEDRCERRELPLEGRRIEARVPRRPALLVLKLAALVNRDLAYRATFQGRAAMRLGPQRSNRVRAKARSYWLRKAGKDLLDVSLLIDERSRPPTTKILGERELQEPIQSRVEDLHEDTIAFARDMAEREDLEDPRDALGTWPS